MSGLLIAGIVLSAGTVPLALARRPRRQYRDVEALMVKYPNAEIVGNKIIHPQIQAPGSIPICPRGFSVVGDHCERGA